MGKLETFVERVGEFAEQVGDDIAELRQQAGSIINDSSASTSTTYSSTKINTELDKKVDKEAGKGLSQENYTTAEKQKLAGLESSRWKGTYTSLSALEASVQNPQAGDYADVDTMGADVVRYLWDATDSKWVSQQSGTGITAAQVKTMYESNPDTNAFTDSLKSWLEGMTEQFTTALKNSYDSAATWILTNGSNLLSHLSRTDNPHNVTKAQVGLPNVEDGAQQNVKTDWNATEGDAELLNKPLQTNFNIFNQNKTNEVTISNTTKSSILAATTGTKAIPSNQINDSFIGRVFGKYNNDNTATTATFSFVIGNRDVALPLLNIEANLDDMAFSIDYVVNFSVTRTANVSGVVRIGSQQFPIDLDLTLINGFNFDIMVTLSGGILTTNSSYFHRNYNG